MKYYKIFYLSVIISLFSCQKVKNDEVDATIYVKQYKTATPIANAMVLITRGRPGSGVGSAVVDTLYTDASGKAVYNKKIDDNYMYYAEAYKENYFDTRNSQASVTSGKKDFKTTIFMYAHSFVKLHVKNVNPYNQFDNIRISTSCLNFTLQGMVIDTSFLFCDYGYEFMGDFPNYGYGFNVTKNNIVNRLVYYFVTPPHDTITIDINY
jgi:hypothetical protein